MIKTESTFCRRNACLNILLLLPIFIVHLFSLLEACQEQLLLNQRWYLSSFCVYRVVYAAILTVSFELTIAHEVFLSWKGLLLDIMVRSYSHCY